MIVKEDVKLRPLSKVKARTSKKKIASSSSFSSLFLIGKSRIKYSLKKWKRTTEIGAMKKPFLKKIKITTNKIRLNIKRVFNKSMGSYLQLIPKSFTFLVIFLMVLSKYIFLTILFFFITSSPP